MYAPLWSRTIPQLAQGKWEQRPEDTQSGKNGRGSSRGRQAGQIRPAGSKACGVMRLYALCDWQCTSLVQVRSDGNIGEWAGTCGVRRDRGRWCGDRISGLPCLLGVGRLDLRLLVCRGGEERAEEARAYRTVYVAGSARVLTGSGTVRGRG